MAVKWYLWCCCQGRPLLVSTPAYNPFSLKGGRVNIFCVQFFKVVLRKSSPDFMTVVAVREKIGRWDSKRIYDIGPDVFQLHHSMMK